MHVFKVDDLVWFYYTEFGMGCWGNATILFPKHTELAQGKIVYINADKDCVHVYMPGELEIVKFGYMFHEDYFFDSKQHAIDYMHQSLANL